MKNSELSDAFPDADPGIVPCGSRLLVQIRSPRSKSKGGIILTNNDRDTELWNTQIGKVVSMGALAFCNRNTREPWPEGAGARPGTLFAFPSTAATVGP